MGKSLETIGFVELADDLAQMAARIAGTTGGEGVIESILNEAAQPVLEAAQRMVPVKSGKLRAAIKAGKVKKRKGGSYTIRIGTVDKKSKTDAYYAPFVEFGHGGPHGPAAPHPFMRPAYDATREQAYGIIRDRLKSEIDKIGG